jgi:hypothetical protein
MGDINRISTLLELLNCIWQSNQDIRFNPILYILHSRYCNDVDEACRVLDENSANDPRMGFDLFYVKDDQFIEFLKRIGSKEIQL